MGVHLVFPDESGFMLTPTVRRTFAPRGQTPIHYTWDRRDRLSAISAITVSPKRHRLRLYFQILPRNVNIRANNVVDFLRHLRRQLGNGFTVVWDRSNTHDRSKAVQAYLAKHPEIVTEKFPGYAPELNPDEGVWQHVKHARLPNFAPRDAMHLCRRLHVEFRLLGRRPNLLSAFIRKTKLRLAV